MTTATGPAGRVRITFSLSNGSKKVVDAALGDSLLDVAHDYDIDIEGELLLQQYPLKQQ
jgi:hypothetical protein